ncbi:MBL fold metallo-hydrolase [Streptomyces sp. 4503]|uniref:MBL fold metallo-hydrolase n=2 Tax=Streptomyces niphimycinicus TaxID=2842201 RepID=A0ABS6CD21_9ACTN|nr:MBL fold metallo-hydrolase [Streptomyces niphimycinicus]
MHSDRPLRPMNRRGFIGAAAGISAGFGAAALLDGGRGLTSGTHGTPAATSEQAMQASTITLGNVTISRVVEYTGPVGMTSREFFPDSPEKLWRQNRSWLSPDFWNPDTDAVRIALQTWVLRSEGRTILIDTGAGNDKFRPYAKTWQYLDTGFLRRLSRAGVRPQDVDIVVNTHLHNDHVGWNTRRQGRDWVPTFPNATYLIPETEFTFWSPEHRSKAKDPKAALNVWEDSILPVHQAGLVKLWAGSHTIDGNLTLDLAPGHTPGSSVVRLQSGGDRAVFAGDLLHTPLQLEHPEFDSCFEEDEKQARTTRRRTLEWAADHKVLVLPAHLCGHGAVEIARNGSRFRIKKWAGFSPI